MKQRKGHGLTYGALGKEFGLHASTVHRAINPKEAITRPVIESDETFKGKK